LICPNDIRGNCQGDKKRQNYQEDKKRQNYQEEKRNQNCQEDKKRQNYQEDREHSGLQEETRGLEAFSVGLCKQMGDDAYYALPAIFTEMPFIRPMGRNTQLPNTIRYIDMNPQRLATKRLKPGFFRVQKEIVIGGRSYDGVGNTMLLMAEEFTTVHVRNVCVKAAEQGDDEQLRNYKNSCVLKARKGWYWFLRSFLLMRSRSWRCCCVSSDRSFVLLTMVFVITISPQIRFLMPVLQDVC
jgi:hypothetical protein